MLNDDPGIVEANGRLVLSTLQTRTLVTMKSVPKRGSVGSTMGIASCGWMGRRIIGAVDSTLPRLGTDFITTLNRLE